MPGATLVYVRPALSRLHLPYPVVPRADVHVLGFLAAWPAASIGLLMRGEGNSTTFAVSPNEVRIEHSVSDQRAVINALTGVYVLLAVCLLVAGAFAMPDLLPGAAFFVGVLVWWCWRIRRTRDGGQPWRIVLTPAQLRHTAAGVDITFCRSEVRKVQVKPQGGPVHLTVLAVDGRDHRTLLTVSLPGPTAAVALKAAFEAWGWPVDE